MALLSRDQILIQRPIKKELVSVPEWGGEVYVRELTAIDRDSFESALAAAAEAQRGRPTYRNDPNPPPKRNVRGTLVALAVCDEQGNPILTAADAAALGACGASVIDRVFDVAARLAGISKTKENSDEAAEA